MSETVTVDQKLCAGCGQCVQMCLQQILYIDEEANTCRVTDERRCDRRRGCEKVCPSGAIRIQ